MRYLVASIWCFLLAPSQAHACRGAVLENTLFFETLPDAQPAADVIAKVILSDVNVVNFYKGTATAKVLQVIRANDDRVQEGRTVSIKFMVSSCGPHHSNGNEGTIVAKPGIDSEGRLVLYPYMRRYGDGRITTPCIGKLQGKITDSCTTD